jgi:putative inorganic carbon (hco3(-)) transporter
MIKLHIRFKTMIISLLSVLAVVFVFQKQIVEYLEKNDDESSSNLMEHFSSMSNITSDASNLERINRWGAAVRMFRENDLSSVLAREPICLNMLPTSCQKTRTIISTNMGDMGNAHSEYFGPLGRKRAGWHADIPAARYCGSVYCNSYILPTSDGYLRGILISAFLVL